MMQSLKNRIFGPDTVSLPFVKWTGHLFFIVYIGFAAYYYLERSTAFDAALYSFKLIFRNALNIENDRWGAAYTELIPLLAYRCGLSLKAFLAAYSLSFAIWNYIFFVVIAFIFRNAKVGLAYLFALVIFYRYQFFYPVSEIHSTIGPLFVLAACLYALINEESIRGKISYALLASLLLFWIANIHIITLIPVCFLAAYIALGRTDRPKQLLPLLPVLVAGLLYYWLKVHLIPKDSYQGAKMVSMEAIRTVFTSLNDVACFPFFKKDISTNYTVLLFFTAAMIVAGFLRKHYLKTFFVLLSLTGYAVIAVACYVKNDGPLNYQNYYCYFGVIIALPLAEELLSGFAKPLLILSVAVLLLHSYYRIVKAGLKFTDRSAYLERTIHNLSKRKEKKFAMCEWNIPIATVWSSWDFPFESIMISSQRGPDSTITFYASPNPWELDNFTLSNPRSFVGLDFYMPKESSDTLSTRYFKVAPGFYGKSNEMQTASFADSVFTKDNMKIIPETDYSLLRADARQISLRIENNADIDFKTFVTHDKAIWLSYHLYKSNGDVLMHDGYRTNVEVDIPAHSSIETGLTVSTDGLAKGEYILEIDLLHEGKRWFGINSRTVLRLR